MKFKTVDITTFDDFRIGNSESRAKGTGCTVIISEAGATGGVDVRGGGPATRETDLLRSENTVESVHAVVLSGGSAMGLEAGSGAARELLDRGVGFRVGNLTVPIVCGASLFDLEVGDPKAFPDVEMGRDAVKKAYSGNFRTGNFGAGTGCTVGKAKGMNRAMKTGLGTFACSDGNLEVGALVAVNAVGDVYNGAGNIIAGLRTEEGSRIFGTIRTYKSMVRDTPYDPAMEDTIILDTRSINEAQSRMEHKAMMTEIAEAIKEELRRTSEINKSDITEKISEVIAQVEDEYTGAAMTEKTAVQGQTAADKAAEAPEEERPVPDQSDLGYDIPFNTTIGCLITNAKLTKAQANKLASILHDAYARAIKPVHGTYDGDTIFVMASGKYDVNFDAFAALATDVMQYAVIDSAVSARSAYGLPSAGDLHDRR